MRKSSVVVLSLSLLLGTAAFALAADAKQAATDTKPAATADTAKTTTTTTTTTKTTKKPSAYKSVRGDVASVDEANKSFTVHPKKGADVTLKTNDKTTYTLDGKPGTWSDVKVGLWVSATYKVEGADNWAHRVTLKNAPAAKPAMK